MAWFSAAGFHRSSVDEKRYKPRILTAGPENVVSLIRHHLALAAGHGIRIGLEDNIWLDGARTTLASNRSLLQRITAIASHLELTPATPEQVRKQLGLNPGKGRYGLAEPLTVKGDA